MFGIKRRLIRRQIDNEAINHLRRLGLSQIEAVDVIHEIRRLYKDTRFTAPNDAVQATPMFYAAGLNWEGVRRALHAAAALAHVTGTSYEYMAQILFRVAAQGRITGQEVAMLRRRGVPFWMLYDDKHMSEKWFRVDVRLGYITYEDIISAILDNVKDLKI